MKNLLLIMLIMMLLGCTQTENIVMAEIKDDIIQIEQETYVLNPNSMKIHIIGCISERNMLEENKVYTQEMYEILIEEGYENCQNCNPRT